MRNRIFDLLPCPSLEDWQALLAGDLSTPRISEMETHLEGCLVCVAQLDALTPTLSEHLREAAREPAATTPAWADDCSRWAGGAGPAEPAADGRLIFERTGKYQSHGRIAFGGMGEVYRGLGRVARCGDWVAIKIPSLARRSPDFIARFREEARGQAQLEHEFIARVYDGDEQDGVPYFSMELVDGETLARASRAAQARPAPRRGDDATDCSGRPLRPQERRLPSRPEAGQHHVDGRR